MDEKTSIAIKGIMHEVEETIDWLETHVGKFTFAYLWVTSDPHNRHTLYTRRGRLEGEFEKVNIPDGKRNAIISALQNFDADFFTGRFVTIAALHRGKESPAREVDDVVGVSICKTEKEFNKAEGRHFAITDLALRLVARNRNVEFGSIFKQARTMIISSYWQTKQKAIKADKKEKERRGHWRFLKRIAGCQLS